MPVYKDKNKHWYFVVTINYKQYKRVKWNNQYMLSKTEAQKAEREFLEKIEGISSNDMKVIDLFNEYIKASKSSFKASTLLNYDKFKRNYLNSLENKKIHDLKPNDILSWRENLNNANVSVDYKNRIQNIMKSLLNYGTIMYNLNGKLQFSLLQPFKDNNVKDIITKSKYLEADNFRLLLKPLDETDYYYITIWTLYYTGLRIGELAALKVEDITKDYISINKDYSRVKGKDIIQAPKNDNSIRRVPLDPVTSNMLQEFIKDKAPYEIAFHKESKYLNQQKLRRCLNKLQLEAGLEDYDITPHTLRHSYSSNLKKLGYDEYTIAKLMGNTPEVASSTYIHTNLDFKEISEKILKIE
ncbi:MAG: site-specific integrase [Acholeplasmatales bacterium]|nr:site-specific integrase [Acholeplasmatales bacterium]